MRNAIERAQNFSQNPAIKGWKAKWERGLSNLTIGICTTTCARDIPPPTRSIQRLKAQREERVKSKSGSAVSFIG